MQQLSLQTTADRVLRTLIIDDHELVARAIEVTFDRLDDFSVVEVATTIDAGVEATARRQPDLILTDLRLSDGDVVDHLQRFKGACPSARVLVMTGMSSECTALRVLRAGADGYVMKAQPLVEFVAAARRVAGGEVVFPACYLRVLLERSGVLMTSSGRGSALTPREVDVLQLLALGHSTKAVADELRLAVNTVRNHLAGAMTKLGSPTRLSAVAEAMRLGIVSPPTPVARAS